MSAAQQLDEVQRAELLTRYLLARAAEARRDPTAFLELVMLEEQTKQPIVAAPHQKVVLSFIRDHRRGVLMLPRGHSKTFCLVAVLLWMMGQDPNFRGAIVSATQEQAAKILKVVREYIETSAMLRLVFPGLKRGPNKFDPWHASALTVARPPGTRDATLIAVGLNGAILGSRLKVVFVDDVLTDENAATEESRRKVIDWIDGAVLQTLDRKGDTKAYLVGTAFHPRDLLHEATRRGWATLKMDVVGNVFVQDDVDSSNREGLTDQWDHEELRPGKYPYLRLRSHDPDPLERQLLFPMRFCVDKQGLPIDPQVALEKIRREAGLPHKFQQMYMMVAHDYASAMCKPEWIERCKQRAREMGVASLVGEYRGTDLVFVGVDLGIEIGEHNDDTSIFTFSVLPSGHRRILDIEYGKWDGAAKVQRVMDKARDYNAAIVMVESNGGQKLLAEWALDKDIALPVKAVQTDARKAHPELGLPGFFLEIYNAAWLIPNDQHGNVDPRVQRFIDECINYVPDKHTGDVLMSAWLAQKGARQWGVGTSPPGEGNENWAQELMSR